MDIGFRNRLLACWKAGYAIGRLERLGRFDSEQVQAWFDKYAEAKFAASNTDEFAPLGAAYHDGYDAGWEAAA